MIVHATVTNGDKFKQYSESASKTLKTFGADIMFKGRVSNILTGDHHYNISAVMKFPDQKSISAWYHSTEYQALIPLREAAANVVFIGIEV